MPQTGPDLVSAAYPIGRPLAALLGGTTNATQGNVPVCTNLDFALGVLTDVSGVASGSSGSVNSVAVPVTPGTVISKISWVIGATSSASAGVTNLWSALYTGTGSAPGTTGAQPTLIAQTASLSGTNVASVTLLTFTFATPQSITSVQAPYGYVYASLSATIGSASPNVTTPSLISMTAAASTSALWYSTSPFGLYLQSNGGAGSAAPTTIGTAVRAANPPVVLLT